MEVMAPVSIHSHVQRSVLAEREASVCRVHLHGRAASVQQGGVHAPILQAKPSQQLFQLTEASKHRPHLASTEKQTQNERENYTGMFVTQFLTF